MISFVRSGICCENFQILILIYRRKLSEEEEASLSFQSPMLKKLGKSLSRYIYSSSCISKLRNWPLSAISPQFVDS